MINKRLGDSELIYEECVLVWNMCLPLMSLTYRDAMTKPLQAVSELLEEIESTDHSLRVKLHLELSKIYFGKESTFSKVEEHLLKAMALDSSIPLSRLAIKFGE